MALPAVGAILSFLGGWFARLLGSAVVRAIALRAMLLALFVTVLPRVLYNLLSEVTQEIFDIVSAQVGTSHVGAQVLQVAGLAGWFAIQLHIPEAFSLIMTAVAFRVTISFIPYVGRL